MNMIPLAIWGHKLDKDSLFAAVKLIVMLVQSNDLVIEASYIYCYALTLIINGKTSPEAFKMI